VEIPVGDDKVTATQPRPISFVNNDDERSSFVVIQTRNLGYTHPGGSNEIRGLGMSLGPVKADPFVVVSLLSTTPFLKRSTNPIYAPKDATSRYTSPSHVVELVVWDKDMLTKEYLGEVSRLMIGFGGKKVRRSW
jgi:hypothetical protein